MDVELLARGLVAGVLVETIDTKGRTVARVLAVLGVVAALVGIVAGGWIGALAIAGAVLFALGAALAVVARRVATAAVRHVGEPASLTDHREAIDRAIGDAALPTGPIAALKFGWRLRRGADDETKRLWAVVQRLRDDLDAHGAS